MRKPCDYLSLPESNKYQAQEVSIGITGPQLEGYGTICVVHMQIKFATLYNADPFIKYVYEFVYEGVLCTIFTLLWGPF